MARRGRRLARRLLVCALGAAIPPAPMPPQPVVRCLPDLLLESSREPLGDLAVARRARILAQPFELHVVAAALDAPHLDVDDRNVEAARQALGTAQERGRAAEEPRHVRI